MRRGNRNTEEGSERGKGRVGERERGVVEEQMVRGVEGSARGERGRDIVFRCVCKVFLCVSFVCGVEIVPFFVRVHLFSYRF